MEVEFCRRASASGRHHGRWGHASSRVGPVLSLMDIDSFDIHTGHQQVKDLEMFKSFFPELFGVWMRLEKKKIRIQSSDRECSICLDISCPSASGVFIYGCPTLICPCGCLQLSTD